MRITIAHKDFTNTKDTRDTHANPDKIPHRWPSNETLLARNWNSTSKIHAYLE
jgi:hypothetical protein